MQACCARSTQVALASQDIALEQKDMKPKAMDPNPMDPNVGQRKLVQAKPNGGMASGKVGRAAALPAMLGGAPAPADEGGSDEYEYAYEYAEENQKDDQYEQYEEAYYYYYEAAAEKNGSDPATGSDPANGTQVDNKSAVTTTA